MRKGIGIGQSQYQQLSLFNSLTLLDIHILISPLSHIFNYGRGNPPKKRKALDSAYTEIFVKPFAEKYEETWEEEPFWEAVEVFKVKTKEIGLENPFDVLGKYKLGSYEMIRDRCKAGPQACARKNWTSPIVGEKVDVLGLLEKLHHISGRKYEGKEHIVVIEFWATW